MEEFYVTLLSASNSEEYPNNLTSSFTNRLNYMLDLNSDYRVSLSEFSIPVKKLINNVVKNHCKITLSCKFVLKVGGEEGSITLPEISFSIPVDHYADVKELVNRINYDFKNTLGHPSGKNPMFDIEVNGRVSINKFFFENFQTFGVNFYNSNITKNMVIFHNKEFIAKNLSHSLKTMNTFPVIKLENRLATMLGFSMNSNICKEISTLPSVDFGLPEIIYIYCNIVENQTIGHASTQILRMCPLVSKSNGESNSYKVFKNECFLKLSQHQIRTINIELRDAQANLIPFKSGFSSMMLLHFKKAPIELIF
jgi:hypothetical protein